MVICARLFPGNLARGTSSGLPASAYPYVRRSGSGSASACQAQARRKGRARPLRADGGDRDPYGPFDSEPDYAGWIREIEGDVCANGEIS